MVITTYNNGRQVDSHQMEDDMSEKIVRAGLRLPYDLNTWLIIEARKQGVSKNAFILQILWEWVKQSDYSNENKS
jgi:hypothetical protein